MEIISENLAYWYLRLNGFFTIQNFVVHPDEGTRQETDVDLLGVRFPYRVENLIRPMRDDIIFTDYSTDNKILIVVTEVKTGMCNLNGPWTRRERNNMFRVLRAIGAFDQEEAIKVAEELYSQGTYSNQFYSITLLCIGQSNNLNLKSRYPQVRQILWIDILKFIYVRLRSYSNEKVNHQQWDNDGKRLWHSVMNCVNREQFTREVCVVNRIST